MIIKYCLTLYAKSPSAYKYFRYDEKNGTGALILPSERTLRDYRNYIRPKTGFNQQTIERLTKLTEKFSNQERFVVLSFDEMKIQEDLVWNKHTGELVGYVDLGDESLNEATLKNCDDLATHVLVFLVKSVINPLSFSFATFATKGVTSFQIFPLFWKAVCLLEMSCNLRVVAATSDGASPNRTFFKMHKGFVSGDIVVYRTPNIYAEDENTFIYFFSDIPHLLKTLRNNLLHSGSEGHTRFMFKDGGHILWKHIKDYYMEDSLSCYRHLNKITPDHIFLTSYSKMNVKLAAQLLSSKVATTLKEYGDDETQETAVFCELVDKWFDCGNVRHPDEHKRNIKPDQKPFESLTDARFDWLENKFLKYFQDWLKWINTAHPGMKPEIKGRMFISWQTYEGLQISTMSLIHCTKYLLKNGIKYVLTNKFNQDDLENYFGWQRSIGRRKDNPSHQQVRINDNIIKSSLHVAPNGTNCEKSTTTRWSISDEPVPKKPRT